MEHDNPEFEEAFGIYVGPATYDEVVAALRDLPAMSELVVRTDNRESPGRRRVAATGTAGLSTSTRSTRTAGFGTCLSSTSTSRRSGTA
jgi:hypothetical protein